MVKKKTNQQIAPQVFNNPDPSWLDDLPLTEIPTEHTKGQNNIPTNADTALSALKAAGKLEAPSNSVLLGLGLAVTQSIEWQIEADLESTRVVQVICSAAPLSKAVAVISPDRPSRSPWLRIHLDRIDQTDPSKKSKTTTKAMMRQNPTAPRMPAVMSACHHVRLSDKTINLIEKYILYKKEQGICNQCGIQTGKRRIRIHVCQYHCL